MKRSRVNGCSKRRIRDAPCLAYVNPCNHTLGYVRLGIYLVDTRGETLSHTSL